MTGAGKAFSSGFELRSQAEATPQGVAEWGPILEADFNCIMSFWNMAVPTIAAVNGAALARRISQLDAMAMRRTKQAMHRTYELMGMQSALRASLDIDIMLESEGTDLKRGFLKVLREEGLGKALAWREARFVEPEK